MRLGRHLGAHRVQIARDIVHFNQVKDACLRREWHYLVQQRVILVADGQIFLYLKARYFFACRLAFDNVIVDAILSDKVQIGVFGANSRGALRPRWKSAI